MEMHSKISVQNNKKTVKCDEDMSLERYISQKKGANYGWFKASVIIII